VGWRVGLSGWEVGTQAGVTREVAYAGGRLTANVDVAVGAAGPFAGPALEEIAAIAFARPASQNVAALFATAAAGAALQAVRARGAATAARAAR